MPSFSRAQGSRGRRSNSHLGGTEDARAQELPASAPVLGARYHWAKLPGLVLLLGSLWVLYGLFTNPRFRVRELVVEGANLVRPADLRRVVNVVGENLFRVNSRELAARLQSEFGFIERVSIRCRLPNQVFLTVEEQEAVLVWESGGRYWWIGRDGQVLGETEGPGGLVVVHDAKGFAGEPQGHIAGVPWGLARRMREAVPAIQAFDYTSEEGLILYVSDRGWPVYLGHEGDASAKAAVMWALVDELRARRTEVAHIDLRNERRPVFKRP